MVAGQGTPDQAPAKELAKREPEAFAAADRPAGRGFGRVISLHSSRPASMSCRSSIPGPGGLPRRDFERWCVQPTRQIVAELRAKVPERQGDRLSARRRRENPALCRRDRGRTRSSLETGIDRDFARARNPVARAGAGQSRSRRRCSPAARRSIAKSTPCSRRSPPARSSSISATAFCRRRRSRMSSGCSSGCAAAHDPEKWRPVFG